MTGYDQAEGYNDPKEHEQTLNVWLADALKKRGLDAKPEVTHGSRRIDVEVRIGPATIAVEAEHGQSNAKKAEAVRDADARLKQKLVQCAVAVCYPDYTTPESMPKAQLIWAVRDETEGVATWTSGGLEQLSSVIRLAPMQLGDPDAVAAALSNSLDEAVRRLSEAQKRELARSLDLPPSRPGKGRQAASGRWNQAAKRSLLVIATAVMFHSGWTAIYGICARSSTTGRTRPTLQGRLAPSYGPTVPQRGRPGASL